MILIKFFKILSKKKFKTIQVKELFMSNIHVPIDISDLQSSIPPDEEIIYSTLARGALAVSSKYIGNWKTHVLITRKGIAFFMYQKKDHGIDSVYVTLHKIIVPGMTGALRIPEYCHLYLERHPSEDKKDYKKRERAFEAFISQPVIEAKKMQIEILKDNDDKNSQKKISNLEKEIKKTENVLKKWSKWL
ncbi:MAG: hypothetical protein EAX96_04150 [Candidatus Lokiarchaeota archaeon]|nr:hypothetical protein [Candidatus Lokiarchaeota archaeon]